MKTKKFFVGLTAVGTLSGCVAASSEEASLPDTDTDGLEAQQKITNVNADGTWTADALTPTQGPYDFSLYFKANFTGPSGKTRKMGMCALRQYRDSNNYYTPCTATTQEEVDAQCANSPSSLPSGSWRYCVGENGSPSKRCHYRPGPETSFCVGSPALGYVPVAPSTASASLLKTQLGNNTRWITYACFEACKQSDPSASSSAATSILLCGGAPC